MDHHRAVVLEHQQPQRLRQDGIQAAGVDDLAAGDDQAHGAKLAAVRTRASRAATPSKMSGSGATRICNDFVMVCAFRSA